MKKLLAIGLSAAAVFAASGQASAADYNLCGQRSYSLHDSSTFGIYRFNTIAGDSEMTEVKELLSDPTAGGLKIDDRYYAFAIEPGDYGTNYNMYVYDAADNYTLITRASCSSYFMSEGQVLALNPKNGDIYVAYSGSYYGMQFGKLSISNRSRTKVADLDTSVLVMACDADGKLYAVTTTGYFYSINPANGDMSYIGSTGVSPNDYSQSACMSPDGTAMYWAAYENEAGKLYKIDVATGRATKIKDMPSGELFASLWIDSVVVTAGAPGQATALTADFPGGSLSGTVSFTMPTVRHDGAALSGSMTYSVAIDGAEVATGSAEAGQQVLAQCVAPYGKHDITVVCSNAEGEGDTAELKGVFFGKDIPGYATDIRLTAGEGGAMTLTWNNPTAGVNGGYFDASEVKIRVRRMTDDAILSDDATSPFVDIYIPERPTKVFYEVIPYVSEEIVGLGMPSNKIMAGNPYTVPYSEDFTSSDGALDYIIEARDDMGRSWDWQYDFGYFRIYNNDTEKNDWLFTPYIALEPNMKYLLAFDVRSIATESYAVAIGLAPESTAMTQQIAPNHEFDEYDWQHMSHSFTVPAAGNYHIGFHANTPTSSNALALYLDNVSLVSEGPTGVADVEQGGVTIALLGRTLSLAAPQAARAAVYAADGRIVYSAEVATANVELLPGIYVVKLGSRTEKIIVR